MSEDLYMSEGINICQRGREGISRKRLNFQILDMMLCVERDGER